MNEKKDSDEDNILEDLISIPSIGNLTARALYNSGYRSISKLKNAELEDIKSIDHIGKNLAEDILKEIDDEASRDEIVDKKEFRCPVCNKFTRVKDEKCKECDEPLEATSRVVVPNRGLIEEPLRTLASVEEKILFDEEDPESWFIRGSILESMGANRKALESFDRVIELDPLFDHIWNAKANVSLKIGETGEAAKAYKLAFDAHQGPNNLMKGIEQRKTPSQKSTEKLEEKDEKDEKLDKNISKARDLLDQIDNREEELSELIITLDRVIEEKTSGNQEKALDLVNDIIKQAKALLKLDEHLPELENKIENLDSEELRKKAEKDLEEIKQSIKEDDLSLGQKLLENFPLALQVEKEKLKRDIPSEEEINRWIKKLEDVSRDLSSETEDVLGVSESVSRAKASLKSGDIEKSFEEIQEYIDSEKYLINISENIEKIKTLMISLEELDLDEGFIEDVEERLENGLDLCRKSDYESAKDVLNTLLEDIEENIEKNVENIRENIEIKIEEMERLIDKGKEKGLEVGDLESEHEELKSAFESGVEDENELLDEIEDAILKAENALDFKYNISQIEKLIDRVEDQEEYIEKKEEIEDLFQKGDHEGAKDESSELKKKIEEEIEEAEHKKQMKEEAENTLSEARKKLAKLRKTDFDLDRVKSLLKNSNQARKNGDFENSLKLSKKFNESADHMLELTDTVEKANDLLEKLSEKELIDENMIKYEIDQYKKLIDLEKHDLADRYLKELINEMEEGLENGEKVPPPGKGFDKSSTQIPTQIKEKVRNVKELNNLVEKADIEIEVNREPLKDAIIKIKDIEYEEADEILDNWKDKLIERLNHELGGRVDNLRDELENNEPLTSIQRRGNAIFRDIMKKWRRTQYKKALEGLIKATEFIEDVEEKNTDKDKEIFIMNDIFEDLESSKLHDQNIKELMEGVKESKDDEGFEGNLEELRDEIKDILDKTLEEEKKKLENRMQNLNRKKSVIALSDLIDLSADLRKDNIESASWAVKEYIDIVEEE